MHTIYLRRKQQMSAKQGSACQPVDSSSERSSDSTSLAVMSRPQSNVQVATEDDGNFDLSVSLTDFDDGDVLGEITEDQMNTRNQLLSVISQTTSEQKVNRSVVNFNFNYNFCSNYN